MRKSSCKVVQRTGGVKLEQRAAVGRCMPLSNITRRKGDPCQPLCGKGKCDSARSEGGSLCERKRERDEKKARCEEGGLRRRDEGGEGCRVGDNDASSVSALTPRRNLLSIRHHSSQCSADVPGESCIPKTLEHGAQEEERAG